MSIIIWTALHRGERNVDLLLHLAGSIECNATYWTPLNHAEFSTSGALFPDVGSYSCNLGYEATVATAWGQARCAQDGTWIPSAYKGRRPVCVGALCFVAAISLVHEIYAATQISVTL